MSMWQHHADHELGQRLREFTTREVAPVAAEIDKFDLYPVDLVNRTAAQGWNAASISTKYGGAGLTMVDTTAIFEELGYSSPSLAISLISIFQSSKIIELYGSESLKERVLPRFADGLRGCYALTESGRGSDIRSTETKAHRAGDGWIISGEKAFITSGSKAQLCVVLAETEVGVSAFAVDRDLEGVSTRETELAETFGLRNGPHVDLLLDGVRLDSDALIGTEGKGLRQAMVTLSNSRTLAAAISLGIARAAFDGSFDYAQKRSAFGGHVIDFQGIQWYFAELAAELDAARLTTYQAAEHLDNDGPFERSSSAAKLLASRVATKASEIGIQVCGAHGTRVVEPFERFLRDAKTYEIAGGSSEILKNTIVKQLLRETGYQAGS